MGKNKGVGGIKTTGTHKWIRTDNSLGGNTYSITEFQRFTYLIIVSYINSYLVLLNLIPFFIIDNIDQIIKALTDKHIQFIITTSVWHLRIHLLKHLLPLRIVTFKKTSMLYLLLFPIWLTHGMQFIFLLNLKCLHVGNLYVES